MFDGSLRYLGVPSVAALVSLILLASLAPAQQSVANPAPAATAPATAAAPAGVPPEVLQSLLDRLEQLERRDREREEAARRAEEERSRDWQRRVDELEAKVRALESGRVLPEITLGPEDGPTPGELDQRIRVTERRVELAAEEEAELRRQQARLAVGTRGVEFASADTNFVFRLGGLLQVDSRTLINDDPLNDGNDTFALRRARPIFEGTLHRDFDFRLVPDFAPDDTAVFDASFTWRALPELQVQLGKFKAPIGYEQLMPDDAGLFNERGLPSALTPVRNVGLQLGGAAADGRVEYAAGVFNNAGDGRNPGSADFTDDKLFAGRVFLRPFATQEGHVLQGLGFGVGGSYSQVSSNALGLPGSFGGRQPGYITPALQQFFAYNPAAGPVVADGRHWRLAPQAAYTYGPFGLLVEYAISDQGVLNASTFRTAEVQHTAWQVAGQWVLTGERASFGRLVPDRPFQPGAGGWGALQLVGRFGQLDIDDDTFQGFSDPTLSASKVTSWSAGVNWWLNRNLRVLVSYTHSSFDGGGQINPNFPLTLVPPATVVATDEHAILTRVQLSF